MDFRNDFVIISVKIRNCTAEEQNKRFIVGDVSQLNYWRSIGLVEVNQVGAS